MINLQNLNSHRSNNSNNNPQAHHNNNLNNPLTGNNPKAIRKDKRR
jgi:hypothetical protein